MSQTLLMPTDTILERGFSIGICAADRAANLENLLLNIENEPFPENFTLMKVIIVASGCDPKALALARQLAYRDQRFELIEEPVKRGKPNAINQIIDKCDGRFLVLINSDALPQRGAISELLRVIDKDRSIGVASAAPFLSEKGGTTGNVLQLIWGVHNECLLKLNYGDQNNRCCDELIVVRTEALSKLPSDTVNDGAFLAGNAHLAGYTIRFCENARVEIDVPRNFVDIFRQRRRIVYGHFQIWKSVGQPPKTLESMLITNPVFSFSILIKTLARSPKLVIALPVALMGEAVSAFLAIWDNLRSTNGHVPWERYGSKS